MQSCGVRLSVCLSVLSVTFVFPIKVNKFKYLLFLPSDSHTILVFPHQTLRQYSDGDPLTRASNACGVNKDRDSGLIYGLIACRERCDRQVTWHIQLRRTVASWWHSSLVSGRRFLFAGDDDEVFVTRSHNVTPKTAEQNLTVCSGKSKAAITNISTRPRSPLDHVAVTSRQWIQSQSTETTRAGLRDLRRGRALSVSVHYRRR